MSEIPPTEAGTPRPAPGPTASETGKPEASTRPEQQARPDIREPRQADPLRGSKTGRAWVSVVALGVVLILLIVFIAQNTRSVTVSFLGWEGRTSLAVALLIATAAGLFLAAVAGTLRIWQLRRRVKRETKAGSRRAAR